MKGIVALICGLVFGAALAMSGMTDTAKVLGFLDITGNWIPDLAFVMGGAVLVTLIAFRFVLKAERPLLSPKFFLPTKTAVDGKLMLGSGIFGIGWGVYGYCPGPAMSALAYGDRETVMFVVAMLVGMAVANKVARS